MERMTSPRMFPGPTLQLVGVAHHDDAAAIPQRRDEGLKQLDVHHAHLVEDDHIALEQVLVVVDEADHAAGVVHFQQPVDGGSLPARQLAQPLGCAARGGTEGHPLRLMLQQLQDGVDGGGLAGAGAAGQYKAVLGHSLADGFLLERRIGEALRQLQDLNVPVKVADGVLAPPGQQSQPVGNILFRRQQVWQINIRCAVKHPNAEFLGLKAAVQRGRQLFRRLVDEIGRRIQQLCAGQTGVAVARVMAQGAQQGRFQPLCTVPFHMVILGDAVGVAEVELQWLAAEQVGVGGNGVHGAGAEDPKDFHGAAGADLELGEVGDEFPHPEHPLELLLDAVGLVRRDAGDGDQLGWVVRNHFQRLCAEFIDNLVGRPGSDVGQRPAGKEGVDGLQVLGHVGLALLRVELAAIGSVVLVLTAADDALARVQLPHHAADHREHPAAGDLKDGVARVRILVDDVLDRALDLFQFLFHRLHRPFCDISNFSII